MLRAVLDANVYAKALIRPEGPSGEIFERLLRDDAFRLLVTRSVEEEVARCLRYPRIQKRLRFGPGELDAWLEGVFRLAERVEEPPAFPAICRDPDDDKYLAAAAAGGASFLATEDEDLLVLNAIGRTRILTPLDFLRHLRRPEGR